LEIERPEGIVVLPLLTAFPTLMTTSAAVSLTVISSSWRRLIKIVQAMNGISSTERQFEIYFINSFN
jgi:hypothetical protein